MPTAVQQRELRALQQGVASGKVNPQAIVDWVKKNAMGKPYQWGGTGPAGFDCSGLVVMAFKGAGIKLNQVGGGNRSTTIINGSHKVPLQQAIDTPGALLYMPGSPPHIGISMGGGKVLESRGGKGVGIYNVSDQKWTTGGLVPGMSNLPPELGELNNVAGGGQIGGGPSGGAVGGGGGGGGGDVSNASGASAASGSGATSNSSNTSPTSSSSQGVSLDQALLDQLWAMMEKRNAEAAADKLRQLAPQAPKEAAQKVAKALMANPKLAAAAKENPMVLQALMAKPEIADKLNSGEMNVDQALAALGATAPEGGGSFASTSSGSSGLVDLGGGGGGGPSAGTAVPAAAASPDLTAQVSVGRGSISA